MSAARASLPRVQSFGAGRPIVLVHGWSAQGDFFAPQHALATDNCAVIAVDLPGHGPFARPDDTLTIAALADALGDFLREAALDRPVIVGWSMGAMVALDMLARSPEIPIGQLVVLDMTPRVANDSHWRCGLANGQTEADMIRSAEGMAKDWRAYAPRIARALFARGKAPAPALLAMAEQAMLGNDGPTMAALWRSLARSDHRDTFCRLVCPISVILGGNSRIYGPELAAYYHTILPAEAIHVLDGAGHAPQLECPEAVNTILARTMRLTAV